MGSRWTFSLVLLLFIMAGAGISSAHAMRCGSRLISEGDPGDKVINECGPPTSVDSWEEERYNYYDRLPPSSQFREFERYGNSYRVRAFIRVEIWTYNYGPSRFLDYVRLENGIVRKVFSGSYGY